MSEQRWDVYYRTVAMGVRNEKGFRRAGYVAESGWGAVSQLLEGHQNVIYARVYPMASAYACKVELVPVVHTRHEPHEVVEDEDGEEG